MRRRARNVRTDLALEAKELLSQESKEDIPGVLVDTVKSEDIVITRVNVSTKEASRALGKPAGKYITIEAPGLRYKNTPLQKDVMNYLAQELSNIISLPEKATVLVVGLGNWNVTPDALGPRAVEKIVVTRHIQEMLSPELKDGVRSVCAVSPGVLGLTGIETAEIIQGITQKIKPDAVIAIDALAAASSSRLITTVQLANTGIHPGSGVENKRFGLTEKSLHTPVIAIGVPTVVHASTIAADTLGVLLHHPDLSRYFKSLAALDEEEQALLVREVLPESLGGLMVTPKEVDRLINDIASVVAGGINQALHPHIDYENIDMYLN